MAYLTQSQYELWYSEAELIQLTDRDELGVVDVTVFDENVDRAGKLIDGYISPRNSLPISQALIDSSALPNKCGAIVRYYLHKDCATEQIEKDYKDALKWLENVSKGLVSLGSEDAVTSTAGAFVVKTGATAYDWSQY